MASDEINRAIAEFQDKSRKPVIARWAASRRRRLLYFGAVPLDRGGQMTLTGSIGVIMEGFNYRGLMDKIGLAPMIYKSGKYKDMLSGMRETNEIPAGEPRWCRA